MTKKRTKPIVAIRPYELNESDEPQLGEGRFDEYAEMQSRKIIERIRMYSKISGLIARMDDNKLDFIAEKLKSKREELGLSLEGLSKRLKWIGRNTLSRFEKRQGRPTPETIITIIDWLGIDINELIEQEK